jgi:ubiquinone/menaquinone biosynthesis C-methylase UbiE
MDLERTIAMLRAAGEPTRLRLLAVLSKGELTVTELTQILGQSQPRISRHLKLMCEANLLERFREGAWVFYRIAELIPYGIEANRLLHFIPFDDAILQRDLERLDRVKEARRADAENYFSQNAQEWAEIRKLHIDESEVETVMADLVGEGPFETILDLGTGTGRVLEILSPLGRRSIGLDQSREMLSIARSRLEASDSPNCQVRQGDIYALPFEVQDNLKFDLITIHQVLHFLDDPAAAVMEAARVLAPGGRIVIVDFAPHEMEDLRERHAHRRLGFSDSEVRLWCEAAGLDVTKVIHLPPPSGSGNRLTVSLWLAVSTASPVVAEKSLSKEMSL